MARRYRLRVLLTLETLDALIPGPAGTTHEISARPAVAQISHTVEITAPNLRAAQIILDRFGELVCQVSEPNATPARTN